ncbi:DMT family transporter [Terriglobus tenax]|uniref:DMT family transporter n=1 Tax=Terriglobus tenax TaxID=1111115 RepID=UPI0021E069F1|nr:DMT family transporter [Terriglobus tenax]
MAPTHNRASGFLACATAGAFWGMGFYFGKIALAEMAVGHMVFYRFFFAVLAMLPVLCLHRPGLNRSQWGILLLGAFLGIPVQFLLQFKGLSLTTVSHAALMVGMMPVILAVGATLFAHERLDWIGWVSLVVSTTGAGLIALGSRHSHAAGDPSLAGDLLVVLSLVIALFWILCNKRLMATHSALIVTAYSLFSGLLMLALIVPAMYGLPPVHGISLKTWLALAASGVLCTAASTFLWNYGITHIPASQAGVFLNMEPLIGSILGIVLLGESLGPTGITGGILILVAAITLTTKSEARTKEPDCIPT